MPVSGVTPEYDAIRQFCFFNQKGIAILDAILFHPLDKTSD